jgi:hypothetical protein
LNFSFSRLEWFSRRFLNDTTLFLQFCDYLLFEVDQALYLNKHEFSLPKDNFYEVWLKLTRWFWRRFSKKFQYFFFFTRLLLFPLGEGTLTSFEQTWIPFPQGWSVPSLIKE